MPPCIGTDGPPHDGSKREVWSRLKSNDPGSPMKPGDLVRVKKHICENYIPSWIQDLMDAGTPGILLRFTKAVEHGGRNPGGARVLWGDEIKWISTDRLTTRMRRNK